MRGFDTGHIEMSRTPGRDYPIGALYQPDEPPLEMSLDQLRAVRDAAAALGDRSGVHAFDDFVIFNRPGKASLLRHVGRSVGHRLRRGLAGIASLRRPRRAAG